MENPFVVLDQRLTTIEQKQNKILELLEQKQQQRQQQSADDNDLLSIPEVATLTKSSDAAVRGWIRRGELTSYKPGRRVLVRREDALKKVFANKRKSKLERQQAAQAFLARRGRPKK
jgi:excisionase family DNA binding protein